jgi:hypothetical protein
MLYSGPMPLSLRPLLRSLALSTSSPFWAPVLRKRRQTYVYCFDETVSSLPATPIVWLSLHTCFGSI